MSLEEKPIISPSLAMIISLVAVSTASILIRLTEAPPMTIATWRMVLSSLILIPFFISNGGFHKIRIMNLQDRLTLIGVGVVLAIHFASWITSLSYTSVASSVIFVHVDPIFVALTSHFLLKERVEKKQVLGIITAFLGVSVIAYGDFGPGKENLIGDALSLIGAIALGTYIIAGRHLRQRLDLTTYVTPVYIVSAFVLTMGSIFFGTSLFGYPLNTMLMFAIIALIPMIFGHTVYNWALKWVSAPVVSLSLLGEPIGASILAYLFLGETPGFFTLIGSVLTLTGILICVYKPFEKKVYEE